MNKQKGIASLSWIVIILSVAIIAGGITTWQMWPKNEVPTPSQTIESTLTTPSPTATQTIEPTLTTPSPAATEPYIKVISPNGGEEWIVGEARKIQWESEGLNSVIVWLRDYSQGINFLACRLGGYAESTSGEYLWNINLQNCPFSPSPGDKFKVAVTEPEGMAELRFVDESDGYFSITAPDETADWKTYTSEEYGFEIKYPKNWDYGPNMVSTGPNLVFCPPEFSDPDPEVKCKWESRNGHKPSPLAPVGLFVWKAEDFSRETDKRGVWKDPSGKYVYGLKLFNDFFQDTYDQMLSTFQFIK